VTPLSPMGAVRAEPGEDGRSELIFERAHCRHVAVRRTDERDRADALRPDGIGEHRPTSRRRSSPAYSSCAERLLSGPAAMAALDTKLDEKAVDVLPRADVRDPVDRVNDARPSWCYGPLPCSHPGWREAMAPHWSTRRAIRFVTRRQSTRELELRVTRMPSMDYSSAAAQIWS